MVQINELLIIILILVLIAVKLFRCDNFWDLGNVAMFARIGRKPKLVNTKLTDAINNVVKTSMNGQGNVA